MSGKNINFEDKKMEPLKPQWLKDLARDNLKREVKLRNRQLKSNPKDHDICLWLLYNEEYKRKHGLKLVQNSLVPLDYPYNTVVFIN